MPLLKHDLGLTPFTVGVLGGARFAGLLVVSIPAAAAVTRIGLRRSIVLLQVGFACCMAAFSLAHEVGLAVAAMALGSVFFAASNPATTTAVVQRFPPAWWPRAMNVKQMGVPLGSLIAALALPVAATAVGWRPAILGVAAVTFIGAGISRALYRDGASASLSRHTPRTGLWDLFRHRHIDDERDAGALDVGADVHGFIPRALSRRARNPAHRRGRVPGGRAGDRRGRTVPLGGGRGPE
jgi:MFS family permease